MNGMSSIPTVVIILVKKLKLSKTLIKNSILNKDNKRVNTKIILHRSVTISLVMSITVAMQNNATPTKSQIFSLLLKYYNPSFLS